jgi:two-component system, OmpR family, response regulator
MSNEDDDLDFTRPAKPSAPPPPERMARARKEATVSKPELARTGFYVAMAKRPPTPVIARNGSRHSIFIIEDDNDMLKLVGEILSKAGFLTRFARNRSEINTEFNKQGLPDLVLLDVSLPDADGFAILERIRGNAKIARIPVVMMTGRSEPADVARGLTLGADGYVTKPFKIAGLVAAINAVLDGAQARPG